jgi:MFS family permease
MDVDNDGGWKAHRQFAWVVVGLLVPVALLNYLDRQMLASMKGSVIADIPGIDQQAKWGMILAVFKWVYALLSPLGGWIADRYSKRWVVGLSLLAWSLVTWGTGQVQSYNQLLAARAMMGISEAFYIPTALALISEYHPASTRSRAVGLHQMGIYLGVILGGFSGYIADKPELGWRWAFQSCGWIGIAYALPLIWLLGLHPAPGLQKEHPSQNPSLTRGLLSNRNFWLLVTYFTLPAIAGWVVRDWMPAILKESFQIGQGKAGVSATVYWQVAAIAGAIVGGWLADRWMRHSPRGRIWVSALGMSLIVPAMFGVGFSPTVGSLTMAVAFLCLFGIGWGFFDCNNMPILCQIAPKHQRATGYGIMNLVSISCGGLADWGFGQLQDWHVPLWGIFSAFASLAVVSVFLVLAIRPTLQDGEG